MRRLLTWYLPLVTGIAVSAIFAWGFATGMSGDAGEIVRESPASAAATSPGEEELESEEREELIVLLGDSLARGTGDELGEGIGGTAQ